MSAAAPAATTETAPSPAPAAAPAGYQWPDDLKPVATAKGWDKLGDPSEALPVIARSYLGAEKLLGAPKDQLLRLPADPRAEGAWDKFYQAMGRPDTPDGYKVEKPADLPENYPYDENLIKARLPLFHKHGLSPATVQALSNELHMANVEAMRAHDAEMQKRATDGDAELRRELGPRYDTDMALKDRVIQQYGGQEFADWAKQYGFDRDPSFARMLIKIGRAMGEDVPTVSAGGAQNAKAAADALMADRDFQARLRGQSGPEAQKLAREQWQKTISDMAAG